MSVGASSQLVYLPVDISQRQARRSSTRYQVVLVTGGELSEVYVHLAPVESDGCLGPFLRHGEPLRYGQYPAERSITIPIDHPSLPVIYYLEIGADLAGGGAATTHLFFFHADADRRGSKPAR